MKMMIISLHYKDYAADPEDAIKLLDIVSRMKEVKSSGYNKPYYLTEEQEMPLNAAAIAEVIMTTEPKEKSE